MTAPPEAKPSDFRRARYVALPVRRYRVWDAASAAVTEPAADVDLREVDARPVVARPYVAAPRTPPRRRTPAPPATSRATAPRPAQTPSPRWTAARLPAPSRRSFDHRMTLVDTPRAYARHVLDDARRTTAPVATGPRRDLRRLGWPLVVAAIGLATLLLHVWRLDRSYDLFIDESFYAQLGQSVAAGHLPYATGQHFFLHPPGFFVLEALWIRLVGDHGDRVFAEVYSLRVLVSWLAAVNAVLVTTITARLTSRKVGVLAGLAFMINTYVQRETSFVILETATVMWALAGWALLLGLPSAPGRRRDLRVAAAGLLFGLSVLSKEFGVFVTLVPMVLCLVRPAFVSRREALVAGLLSLVPYAGWAVVAAAASQWAGFYAQVTSGFRRSAGTEQISGFNRDGAPSFLHTLIASVPTFGTAYAYLAVSALAAIWLSWRRTGKARLVGYMALGSVPLLAYSATLGANEEQFYAYLIIPGFVVIATAGWELRHLLAHRRIAAAVVAVAIVIAGADVANYVVVHTQRNDGTEALDDWMRQTAPDHSVVVVTNSVQREIFLRYTMVDDAPGTAIPGDAQYLVVFTKQVDEGYAFVGPSTISDQTATMHLVYREHDAGNGDIEVWVPNTPTVVLHAAP